MHRQTDWSGFAFTTGTSVIINPDGNNYPTPASSQAASGDIDNPIDPADEDTPVTPPDQTQPSPGVVKGDDFGCRAREVDSNQPDVGNSSYIASDVSVLPGWSLLVEEFDLEPITLPEMVMTSEDSVAPDLSDLIGLLGGAG